MSNKQMLVAHQFFTRFLSFETTMTTTNACLMEKRTLELVHKYVFDCIERLTKQAIPVNNNVFRSFGIYSSLRHFHFPHASTLLRFYCVQSHPLSPPPSTTFHCIVDNDERWHLFRSFLVKLRLRSSSTTVEKIPCRFLYLMLYPIWFKRTLLSDRKYHIIISITMTNGKRGK